MAFYVRYSGEDDFRFPALKQRLSSYKKFRYSARDREIEVEGIFLYKIALPKKKPSHYVGCLDSGEEYRLLGLRPPETEHYRIWCHIPADLVSREVLRAKPNLRVRGRVRIDGADSSTKRLEAESVDVLPVAYKSVGLPAFLGFDEMFSFLYSRTAQIHEHGPFMLLASLIGSERRSSYFPDENPGCGINIGTSPQEVPGKQASSVITSAMRRRLDGFIRKVNVGPVNTLSPQLRWNRFLSVKDPGMLSRRLQTDSEVDWNLISDIEGINRLRLSEFTASDINLVFDPSLFPEKLNRDDVKNLRQTLLFAKSTPPLSYGDEVTARIEMKTDELIRHLAKVVEYAPLLFRYRFEPLCDAFLKGSRLEDYLVGGEINVGRKDVDGFFRRAKDAALDFAEYSKDHVESNIFGDVLDGAKDARSRGLYTELLVKGGLTREQMVAYLMDRHNIPEDKASSVVAGLIEAEPAIVVRKGLLYKPVYS